MILRWIAKKVVGGLFGDKIVGSLAGAVDGWVERGKIKEETKTAIALAKQKVLTTQATADITWDQTMAEGSKDSWKDEYWTIILSIPMIGAFIPGMSVHVLNGFDVLSQTPEGYLTFLGVAIAAAFGRSEVIKVARKWKTMGK